MHRRLFLRTGLWSALALPPLESLLSQSGYVPGAHASARPLSFVTVYFPNAINITPANWPTASGPLGTLPRMLASLQNSTDNLDLSDQIALLSGLSVSAADAGPDGAGDHARAASTFLTCTRILKSDSVFRAAPSLDQRIAAAMPGGAAVNALALSLHTGAGVGNCDSGYACAYSNNISWQSESVPAGRETSPLSAFNRLFGNVGVDATVRQTRLAHRRFLVDVARRNAADLNPRLSVGDRVKLDEYLTAVTEVEARIRQQQSAPALQCTVGTPPSADVVDYPGRLRLMYDLMALALECGQQRVMTLMLEAEGNGRVYDFLQFPQGGPNAGQALTLGHHDASHFGTDDMKKLTCELIATYHIAEFSRFIAKLARMRDGAGRSVLADTLVLFGSSMSNSDSHSHSGLPVILAGQGGGLVRSGRHTRFPAGTRLADLLLAIQNAFVPGGGPVGDSTVPLSLA